MKNLASKAVLVLIADREDGSCMVPNLNYEKLFKRKLPELVTFYPDVFYNGVREAVQDRIQEKTDFQLFTGTLTRPLVGSFRALKVKEKIDPETMFGPHSEEVASFVRQVQGLSDAQVKALGEAEGEDSAPYFPFSKRSHYTDDPYVGLMSHVELIVGRSFMQFPDGLHRKGTYREGGRTAFLAAQHALQAVHGRCEMASNKYQELVGPWEDVVGPVPRS